MSDELDAWSRDAQPVRARLLEPAECSARRALAEELAAYNRSLGGAWQAAERLRSPAALAVAAVLRPAPFLGPLRHLLAALGAIRWARDAERILDRPVVAVAVLLPPALGAAYVVARDGRLVRFTVPDAPGADAFRHGAARTLGGLEQVLCRPWPLARRTLAGAGGLVDWTARLLAGECGRHGLVVADARSAPLPGAVAPLYPRLLFWRAQLGLGEDRLLFLRAGGAAPSPAADARAIASEAAAHPLRFRPGREALHLFLDQLLPLLGLVCEPSEAAAVSSLLRRAGRQGAPLVRQRPRCTLVPAAVSAFVRANGAAVEAGPAALRTARDEALGALDGISPKQAVVRLVGGVDRQLAAWEEEVAAAVPGAAGAIARRRRRTGEALSRLESDLAQALRRRHRTLAQAWRQAQALLYPLDGPQDETLAAASLLVPAGARLVDRVLAAAATPGRHFLDVF